MARKLPDIDPLETLPLRYEDRITPANVADFREGQRVFTRATVVSEDRTPNVTSFAMKGIGGSFVVKYFKIKPYLSQIYKAGHSVTIAGTPRQEYDTWVFYHPDLLDQTEYGRICPVYTTPVGISEKRYREHVWKTTTNLLAALEDEIPQDVLQKRGLPTIAHALRTIHHPSVYSPTLDEKALLRLAYKELYELKKRIMAAPRYQAPVITGDTNAYISSLPFKLTDDQRQAIEEIAHDMASGNAMRRLLLGDVGTGKTEVAIAAAKLAHECNYRTLLLAPTTILAEQLYNKCVERLGKHAASIYTGSTKDNPAWIIVGTSALLHRNFAGVGLIIIDEQHKTGVRQRQTLLGPVHALQMTATPIPRTVGLIFHGAVSTSALYQTPFPRDVATKVVDPGAKNQIIGHIRQTIARGGKALIIYPYVTETKGDYKAVEDKAAIWEQIFPGQTMLVHGKLEDKTDIVAAFRHSKAHNVLVATSLIENGLDIPEASILVVAGAEKFGISQLHQLRGRIGRRGNRSTCYFLCYNPDTAQRLKPLETINSGFQIAEIDGEQRGFGDIFGYAQSGYSYKLPYTSLYKKVARWVTEDIFHQLQEDHHKKEAVCTTK